MIPMGPFHSLFELLAILDIIGNTHILETLLPFDLYDSRFPFTYLPTPSKYPFHFFLNDVGVSVFGPRSSSLLILDQ